MSQLVVNTTHGPISLVGHIHTGGPRPTLLVITGAFPPKDYKHDLMARFPGANVLIGLLPGMFSPSFLDPTVEKYAAAYDEVIRLLAPDQPIVAYGVSTGCLITLSLKSPNIRRQVLQEPFFSTAHLWPFIDYSHRMLATHDGEDLRNFLENVFGITDGDVVDREYGALADDLSVPADVLVGQILLNGDSPGVWPSFTTAEDRQRLLTRPDVRVFEGPPVSGHNLEGTAAGRQLVDRVLLKALQAIVPGASERAGAPTEAASLSGQAFEALQANDISTAAELIYRHRDAAPASLAARHDLGAFLAYTGDLAGAERELRAAFEIAPDAPMVRRALGNVLLALGRYEEGWPLYEARHDVPGGPPKISLPYPEWRGESLAGRELVIFPEQGFGDQIQFARFAPILARQAARVTLFCAGPLVALFAHSFPEVTVRAAEGDAHFPDPVSWVMSGTTAGRLGITAETIPGPPYLSWPETTTPAGARIGVATRSNPRHINARNRDLPDDLAAELRAWPGALSLHPEDTGAQTFADTAALINGLDAVVTVDTSIAHLAAAMGKPTYILLPALGLDWRWALRADSTPWYETARLFRAAAVENWDGAMLAIKGALG